MKSYLYRDLLSSRKSRLKARFKLVDCLLLAIDNGSMAKLSGTRSELGKKIQKLRRSLGYSQEELAEAVKISRTHMGHIEQGRKTPSLKVLEKLSRALKVSISEIFTFKKR